MEFGIYNAIIGNDRSINEVCRLINKPRSKKQAKIYYNIESEEINYRPENEDSVNEEEMLNILNHFKKLGKNEEKYVQSFNNIVSQYNENQLKIIVSMLPLNVKAVLEENSPQYQKIVTSNGLVPKVSARKQIMNKTGPSEKLLMEERKNRTSKPVVVPTTMQSSNMKRVITDKAKPVKITYKEETAEDEEPFEEEQYVQEKTKKRGRPRKIQAEEKQLNEETQIHEEKPRKRGRPKKVKTEQEILDQEILPGFNEEEKDANLGFEEESNILPGFEKADTQVSEEQEDFFLPDVYQEDYGNNETDEIQKSPIPSYNEDNLAQNNNFGRVNNDYAEETYYNNFDKNEFKRLLTSDKKIVAFLGTSKNGTSFIVNNVAEFLADSGVNVAILDTTKNKNSYYIYTKNEEDLRRAAANSFENLVQGNPYGVQVGRSLTVYTGLPNNDETIKNFGPILETLVKNHSCILIDCDFTTPKEYFENAQEIYLVQSMDILTIQPLTAFLRELKSKNILEEGKIRIIVNKYIRVKGITSRNIIGGMAFYNDPEMSFMTELFDRNTVKYTEVPFDEEVYSKYLAGIAECEISSSGYPKEFKAVIKNLSEKVYPSLPRSVVDTRKKGKKKAELSYSSSFPSSMNNTLNNMKKNY